MLVRALNSEPFCQSSSYSHPIKDLLFDDRYISELTSDNPVRANFRGRNPIRANFRGRYII
jgi:hypothetical protein